MNAGEQGPGSEPRRWTVWVHPDDERAFSVLPFAERSRLGWAQVEVVEVGSGHDERTEETPRQRAISALEALMAVDGFWGSALASRVSACHGQADRAWGRTEGRGAFRVFCLGRRLMGNDRTR